MSVSVLLENVAKTVGEGPHWDHERQCLLFVDIIAGDVHRWNAETGVDEVAHFDKTVGHVIPCRRGGSIVGTGLRIVHYDWVSRESTIIAEVDQDNPSNFLNDGKCDASGRHWTGTMSMKDPGVPVPEAGSLFSVEKDHAVRTHEDKITISNGLAWSTDNRTMYFIDSIPKKVWAYDFDLNAGVISNKRTVFDMNPLDMGIPDGMTIDTEDKLWVACFFGGRVLRVDPETGTILQTVEIPCKRVTSVCFGGKNLDELFVTTSRHNLTEQEVQKQPLAGSIFKVTGLGVKGHPANMYEG